MRLLALAVLLLALQACASTGDPGAVRSIMFDRADALGQVNAFRRANGLSELSVDERLNRAAAEQSNAMAARDRMSHDVIGPLPRRLGAVGYDWAATAENLGRGYPSYSAAMEGWIGSPGHRRNLMNPNVTEVGFAAARDTRSGRPYWTQIFGAERPPRTAEAFPSAGPILPR
ncbi:CAP domain-containing protein [Aureimonas populi]|uniref:CAP domain-containing protein n=1 Tax=Aureimonas populi TaxID=1701758 RepID=A0ABW5CFW9_9HYPH|nr:CAP domain-containing protein [Aureimonas populi]